MIVRRAVAGDRRASLVAAAALFAAVSCAELGTGIGDVSYIAFDGIPWPSVIAGDTLRDSLGAAAPFARMRTTRAAARSSTPRSATSRSTPAWSSTPTAPCARRRGATAPCAWSRRWRPADRDDRLVRVTRRPDSASLSAERRIALIAYTRSPTRAPTSRRRCGISARARARGTVGVRGSCAGGCHAMPRATATRRVAMLVNDAGARVARRHDDAAARRRATRRGCASRRGSPRRSTASSCSPTSGASRRPRAAAVPCGSSSTSPPRDVALNRPTDPTGTDRCKSPVDPAPPRPRSRRSSSRPWSSRAPDAYQYKKDGEVHADLPSRRCSSARAASRSA